MILSKNLTVRWLKKKLLKENNRTIYKIKIKHNKKGGYFNMLVFRNKHNEKILDTFGIFYYMLKDHKGLYDTICGLLELRIVSEKTICKNNTVTKIIKEINYKVGEYNGNN